MLQISTTHYKHPESKLFENNHQFKAFPAQADSKIDFNSAQFFALGLLNVETLIDNCTDEILLAYPPSEWLAESEYVAYKNIDGKWQLDEANNEDWTFEFEEEQARFDALKSFHAQHGFLQYHPDKAPGDSSKSSLVTLGGQPMLGCNWDAYIWEDEEQLDTLMDAMDEDDDNEQAQELLKRSIVMNIDGDIYHYVAQISCMNYVESSADLIYFYNPQKKRVVMGVDFS